MADLGNLDQLVFAEPQVLDTLMTLLTSKDKKQSDLAIIKLRAMRDTKLVTNDEAHLDHSAIDTALATIPDAAMAILSDTLANTTYPEHLANIVRAKILAKQHKHIKYRPQLVEPMYVALAVNMDKWGALNNPSKHLAQHQIYTHNTAKHRFYYRIVDTFTPYSEHVIMLDPEYVRCSMIMLSQLRHAEPINLEASQHVISNEIKTMLIPSSQHTINMAELHQTKVAPGADVTLNIPYNNYAPSIVQPSPVTKKAAAAAKLKSPAKKVAAVMLEDSDADESD